MVFWGLYFFPRVIIYIFSLFCSYYGGLGFGGGGLGLGFWGWSFQSVIGVLGLWCGSFWVFWGWGSLYKHRIITLGKNLE